MRAFAIESNGTYLGEVSASVANMDIECRPVVTAKYGDEIRLIRIVGVSNPEGETLIPPGETDTIKAVVCYGVRV